jgi:TorA maturation chaperone TorD
MNNFENEKQRRYLAKANVYRILSVCYYEPEQAFLEEDIFSQLETALTTLTGQSAGIATTLGNCFRDAGRDALLLDYTRLFLGPFGTLAKPYGSVYLEGKNIVMGETTIDAMALYSEGGFQVAEAFHEVPDHMAVELEFLYLLNFCISESTEENKLEHLGTLKRTFLAKHLGQWVVPFSKAMRVGADTNFYKHLADLTQRVVLDDMQEKLMGSK